MFLGKFLTLLCAVSSAFSLPTAVRSEYAVKERHIVPRGWKEVESSSKPEEIHLQIGLKQRNEGVIERHLVEISDPNHTRYGQHLSAAEIHEITSPSDETISLVTTWLLEHDIIEVAYSPGRDWVSVLIPIEKAEQLLQTSYTVYKHEDGSTLSRAPEWSLPLHLHEHIDVVQPTTSLLPNQKRPAFSPAEGCISLDGFGGRRCYSKAGHRFHLRHLSHP